MSAHDTRRVILYLAVFVVASQLIGWGGYLVASRGDEDATSLGNLIWMAGPFVVAMVLRLVTRDWSDTGFGPEFINGWPWYVIGFFMFPVIIAAVLLIGVIAGQTSLASFSASPLFTAIGSLAAMTVVKNVLEETAWRGYMTPKVAAIGVHPIVGHLIVGLLWGSWHIPYYLGLVDQATLWAYTSQDLTIFIVMAVIGMSVASILFGEFRLITGSIWPGFLAHTVSNLVILALLTERLIGIDHGAEIIFTPSWEGGISIILIAAAGLGCYAWRQTRAL